jgi:hypothetical protein
MRHALVLRSFAVVLACLVFSCFGAGVVRAQPAGLPAVVSVSGSDLEPAEIQTAIERELGVHLVLDAEARERLEVVVTGRRANVTYYATEREPVTRSVDLPADHGRSLETIAFLAGNLARDEASELLAQLAPPPGTEPDTVPRPEPAPPAPAPSVTAPAVAAPAAAPPPKPASPALIESDRFAANLSLYYPATALKHTEQRRLNLELGILYSYVGAIKGAGVTLGYFRSDGLVQGFSVALGWNRSGPVKGIQAGGLVNEGYGELHGISFATLLNVRHGDSHGVQGALVYAKTDLVFGLQGSAVAAIAREVEGIQGSAVVAVAGSVRGAQVGLVNVAGPVDGLEVGFVSRAGPTRGTQVGFVNVAGSVHGFQLGLVNVADEIHGGALGLVSVAKNGRVQPTAWFAGTQGTMLVGVKSVTDYTYSLFAVGYGFRANQVPGTPGAHRVTHQESFGLHLEPARRLFAEAGIGYGAAYSPSDSTLVRSEVRFEARVGFEPVHGVTPFVGGAVTERIQGSDHVSVRGEYLVGVSLL